MPCPLADNARHWISVARQFRTLNVFDDYNREALGIEIDRFLTRNRVVRLLERLAVQRGYPKQIRSDNEPELISAALQQWAK